MDNTAAIYTLKKGQAREYRLNDEIAKTLSSLAGDRAVSIAHIETGRNPTDKGSRSTDTPPVEPQAIELSSTLRDLGRCLAGDAFRVRVPASWG